VAGGLDATVISVQRAEQGSSGAVLGMLASPGGAGAIEVAVSPGRRWLYATSELSGRASGGPGGPGGSGQGTLSIISLRRAEDDPARSVVSTVDAGCGPVRVITSADGGMIWVTARASDTLLGFSAAAVLSRPHRALIAQVKVGEAPVGLALVQGGKRIVVADSDRFGVRATTSGLAAASWPYPRPGRRLRVTGRACGG
jgi:hypothetical protein